MSAQGVHNVTSSFSSDSFGVLHGVVGSTLHYKRHPLSSTQDPLTLLTDPV